MQTIRVSWHGTISSFRFLEDRSIWLVGVDYWEDSNPDRKIPKVLDFPLVVIRSDVINAIKAKGQEVKAVATLNTQNIIGTDILIP